MEKLKKEVTYEVRMNPSTLLTWEEFKSMNLIDNLE